MLKLKIKRYRKNMTQKDLAKLIDVKQSYVSKLENNEAEDSLTLHRLELLAKALNVCPIELLECNCPKCQEKKKEMGTE